MSTPKCAKVEHTGYRGSDGAVTCCLCDYEMDWQSCSECGGDGLIDLYEEDGINFSPGELGPCRSCRGEGGSYWCINNQCPTSEALSIFAEKPTT